MTDDVVLISTHDLSRAGPLRDAFGRAGYATDLVTPEETLDAAGAVLLVLTGGVEDGGGPLARQARVRLELPVFAIAPGEVTPALRPGFDELFATYHVRRGYRGGGPHRHRATTSAAPHRDRR